jgi:hypothetical protein
MYVLTPGARVRFFSYIGGEYVLGIGPDRWGSPKTVLKHASTSNDHTTTFIIEAAERGCFRLKWGQDPRQYLSWHNPYSQLWLSDYIGYHAPPSTGQEEITPSSTISLFRVDAVKDGNWFALNDLERQHVLDIDHGYTGVDTLVYSWPWNGGDNQIWRTEAVS